MLSIGKIALGQHRYYEQQVAAGEDDYYSGRGEAAGEWVGRGAQALGLAGSVRSDQFSALLAGRHPRSPGRKLRRARGTIPRIAALDLTFSAPKSVSVLAAVASGAITTELTLAHEAAVRAAIEYLEDTAVQVRRGAGGKNVKRGKGLIAAAYRHRMSRALDPQLHTHVVAANLARGPDGRYTALDGAALYRAAKTAGYLYQSHLRAVISERLGLEWGPVHHGAAELEGVPRAVLGEFSKRRREMLREAQRGGISLGSKSAAEKAAIATRDRKQYGIDTHTWRQEVRARAAELGLGRRELALVLDRTLEREPSRFASASEQAVADFLAGPGGLTEGANAFHERDVLQAFAGVSRAGSVASDIRARAERFARRRDVIELQWGEMTTAELLARERELIARAIETDDANHRVKRQVIERVLAARDQGLSAEQARAVEAVASSTRRVAVIEASAGTGKTYIAGVLRSVYEQAGFQVIGVAPTARAARELQDQARIPSRTLHRLLLDIDQLGERVPRGSVVILDEAGMAPTRLSARLLAVASEAEAKVIAIGDPLQLPSVQAGGWLGAVARASDATRLTEVMRQRDASERAALSALRDGRPDRYLDWASAAGRIELVSGRADATRRAIDLWQCAVAASGPPGVAIIARDNHTRAELNAAARELWRALGLLGEEQQHRGLALAVGDRIVCRQNDARLDVDNGTRGVVRELNNHRVVIETDAGAARELPIAYVDEHVEHAYALTGHSMQGGTVERAIVVACPQDLTAGWSYTALSRARGETHLLVVDARDEERSEYAPAPTSAQPGACLASIGRRMLERDDEDLAVEQLAREHPERAAECAEPRLPRRARARLEDLEARLAMLTSEKEQIVERLVGLTGQARRGPRAPADDVVEHAHLKAALEASERELTRTRGQVRQLGLEVAEARSRVDFDADEDLAGSAWSNRRELTLERSVEPQRDNELTSLLDDPGSEI
jgi:conjugative relaxase-like TrwC/TraI family protein